ncbi:hypothetical protein [Kaistella carnis]|uniref:hypothetical protein n=1 Tax=Kaistella carnis TaxID=1241979 RepID=UPI001E3843E5|nr:hypothetical protein [Kaistella carnis]
MHQGFKFPKFKVTSHQKHYWNNAEGQADYLAVTEDDLGTSLDISANPDMFDGVRQNKWNNALFRFGWKSMLGWSYKRNGKVIYPDHITKNTKNHHHHLHVQGYDPNFKEIKK